MRNVEVRALIDAESAKLTKKIEITAERVLAELAGIGFSDLEYPARNEDTGLVQFPLIRAADKNKALELLGKHLKLFTEKVEHQHAFENLTDEQLEAKYRALVAVSNPVAVPEGEE